MNLHGLGVQRLQLLRLHLVRHAAGLHLGDLVHDALELLLQHFDLTGEFVVVVGLFSGLGAANAHRPGVVDADLAVGRNGSRLRARGLLRFFVGLDLLGPQFGQAADSGCAADGIDSHDVSCCRVVLRGSPWISGVSLSTAWGAPYLNVAAPSQPPLHWRPLTQPLIWDIYVEFVLSALAPGGRCRTRRHHRA
ncbi:hypothetical protein D3C73_1199360 [compost metagenome]